MSVLSVVVSFSVDSVTVVTSLHRGTAICVVPSVFDGIRKQKQNKTNNNKKRPRSSSLVVSQLAS